MSGLIKWTIDIENFDLVSNFYPKDRTHRERYRFRISKEDDGRFSVIGDAKFDNLVRGFSGYILDSEQDAKIFCEEMLCKFMKHGIYYEPVNITRFSMSNDDVEESVLMGGVSVVKKK